MTDMKEINKQSPFKFESNLYDFQEKVNEDTFTNDQYLTAPNPIIESYKEMPPATTGSFIHSVSVSSLAKLSHHSIIFNRHDDQVVPAVKN